MTIPPFVTSGGSLPPGDHEATLDEIGDRFTWNYGRKVIYNGLKFVVEQLETHSVDLIWVDGSFVTGKDRPRDVDVAYQVPAGADPDQWGLLSPVRRHDLKKYQRVDLLPYWACQQQIKDYFCTDRNDVAKGIIRLVAKAP